MDSISGEPALAWYWIVVIVAAAALLIVGLWVWMKTRRRPGDHVFRASRLSRGNRIFPAQVVITPTSITLFHPQWIGKLEESIHMAHVASIKIDTNIIFSDVFIETTGGQNPIVCHGHTKGDAVEMKRTIEKYQSEYYRKTT
jgi:predicted small integral membrane protein